MFYLRRGGRGAAVAGPQVLFACFTHYTISSSTDASFALIAFGIWFLVVFAKRLKLTGFTNFKFVRILGSFVAWVRLHFLDSVCCFCGASKASGTDSETFVFVRKLGLFVIFEFGLA